MRWAARGLRALCQCARRLCVTRWTRTGPVGARDVILGAVLSVCASELCLRRKASADLPFVHQNWTLTNTQFSTSATFRKHLKYINQLYSVWCAV